MRHTVLWVSWQGPSQINNIGNHRRGCWLSASARPIIQRGTNSIALNQDSIHYTINIGDKTFFRYQCWVNTEFYTASVSSGYTQVLDPIAQLLCVGNILRLDLTDALGEDLIKLQGNTKRQGSQNNKLMSGINAFHIEGRVSFGITQCLSFF